MLRGIDIAPDLDVGLDGIGVALFFVFGRAGRLAAAILMPGPLHRGQPHPALRAALRAIRRPWWTSELQRRRCRS
jgi:hypothetical protein